MSVPEPVARPGIAAVYRAERAGLLRLAYLLSGSREVAEDAVHAVFADVQTRWDAIDDPPAYLRRAVVNRVKDGQRRGFRRRSAPADPAAVTGIPEVDETWQVVLTLPPHQREVVVLRFYEDLPLVEIAARLGRNQSTVRTDLRRALIRLKKTLP